MPAQLPEVYTVHTLEVLVNTGYVQVGQLNYSRACGFRNQLYCFDPLFQCHETGLDQAGVVLHEPVGSGIPNDTAVFIVLPGR